MKSEKVVKSYLFSLKVKVGYLKSIKSIKSLNTFYEEIF
jgi:hypothetical protein